MSGRPAMVAALLLGCGGGNGTTEGPPSSIERSGIERSRRESRILATNGQLVRAVGDVVHVGNTAYDLQPLLGVAVAPSGQVLAATRGELFIELRTLGVDTPPVQWIAAAHSWSQLLIGEKVGWLVNRESRQATAHPLDGEGPRRLVAHEISEIFADAVLGPNDELWIATANSQIQILGADGSTVDVGTVGEPIERISFGWGALWVLTVKGTLHRFDLASRTLDQGRPLGDQGIALEGGPGFLYAMVSPDIGQAVLLEIDNTGAVSSRVGPFPDSGRELAVSDSPRRVTVGRADAFRSLPKPE